MRYTEIRIEDDAGQDPSLWERLSLSDIDDELLRNEIPPDVTELMFQRGDNFTDSQISQIFADQRPSTERRGGNGGQRLVPPSTRNFRIIKYRNPKTNRSLKILKCDNPGCPKFFRKFHNFYDHLRIHTGERPFVCPFADVSGCSMRFTQKSNLNKHVATHRLRAMRGPL